MTSSRWTLTIDFAVRGRLAYLSHQETLSLWHRVLVRAAAPIRFSEGFNPHPRVSLPLPRPVGVTSEAERLIAQLSCPPADIAALEARLDGLLPAGIAMMGLEVCNRRQHLLPVRVWYQWRLERAIEVDLQKRLEQRRQQLEGTEPIVFNRADHQGAGRQVDIRPYVEQLFWQARMVQICCRVSQQGTARVEELSDWLGLTVEDLAEPVCRTKVEWTVA